MVVWLSIAFLCGGLFALAAQRVFVLIGQDNAKPEGEPIKLADTPGIQHRVKEVKVKEVNPLLVPAPMIGETNLRDWLIHYRRQDNVWPEIVAEFYNEAAKNERIARYFTFTDMTQLQRHFTAALMMVTGVGLRYKTAEQMRHAHRDLKIPPEDFDAVTHVLVQTLIRYKVPNVALDQMGPIVAILRDRIVTA